MIPLNDLAPRITLNGAWDFRLGDQDSWSEIQVPGAWESQGYDRRFEGPAQYRKQVTIPDQWAGSQIFLEFGAVSYACRVVVNDVSVGEHQGLWTPFACDLTHVIHTGRPNLIEVDVYKPSHLPGARYPFRKCLAGFIPDLGTTFGGLWQEVSLQACQAWFEDLRLIADTETEEIVCWFHTCAESNQNLDDAVVDISVSLEGCQVAICTVVRNPTVRQEVRCKIPQPRQWSPENPVLYEVKLSLRLSDKVLARVRRRIGFRCLSTRGEMLLGILHWGWLPDQIAPFFSPEVARDQIRQVKRLGFNLLKLCLFVPNSSLYEVADEEGVFLWQEWPMWLPEMDSAYAAHAPKEYAEYRSLVHHHPSIVIYSAGCELDETVGADLLERLNGVMRQGMNGALFCDNSGMGEAYGGLQVDFADFADYHTYSDLEFFEEMLDHWQRDWQSSRPLIFGEFCDSDTYRDPEKIRGLSDHRADPTGLLPWWLTINNPVMDWRTETRPVLHQEESIAAAELGLTHQQLQEISYAGSLAIRKYVIETVRRRGGIGGYVVTCLRDTPITTSGIFDDFWRPKWDPERFLPFNGECVLCLDGERRRRWQHGGDRVDRLDLQNEWAGEWVHRRLIFTGPRLEYQGTVQLAWRLTDASGRIFVEDQRQVEVNLEGIRPQEIAGLSFQLPPASLPQELYLETDFSSPTVEVRNTWSFWSYPKRQSHTAGQPSAPALYDPGFLLTEFEELLALPRLEENSFPLANALVLASTLPAGSEDFLKSGGRMILLQWGEGPLPVLRRPFWREAIRIFAPHPFWEAFGADGDLRFLGVSNDVSFDLAHVDQAIPGLDEVHPIFRRLDARDFRVSEFLLEARLGRGVLLVCSLRLAGGHGRQPSGLRRNVAGQALLSTMFDYLEKQV
jgi:hypothetical protein